MLQLLRQCGEDLIALLYPNLCCACSAPMPYRQEVLCLSCQYRLPQTKFHLEAENPMTERFWGRIPLRAATALYHFVKGSQVQHLVHQLKYDGRQDIGLFLGRQCGRLLSEAPHFAGVDLIVPVPLHRARERSRGYNQSLLFARGIGETFGRPVLDEALRRSGNTATQTRKNQFERFENVEGVFVVAAPGAMAGRHVLLVDDVLTTGATLEMCALSILGLPGTSVSIATIAFAQH